MAETFPEPERDRTEEDLKTLKPSECWEVKKAAYGMDLVDTENGTRFLYWEYPRAFKPRSPEVTERYRRRNVVNSAVGLVSSKLEGSLEYESSLKDTGHIESRAEKMGNPDIMLAARALAEQIRAGRQEDFARQIDELNRFVQEDPGQLGVRLTSHDAPDLMVILKGFRLSENENGDPVPELIVAGQDGQEGLIPGRYRPFGLHMRSEARQEPK